MDRDNWLGSFYELAIEYAPYGDVQRLLNAQQTVWRAPAVEGPYEAPYKARDEAFRPLSLPTSIGPEDTCHLYGVLSLPHGHSLGVLSVIVREPSRSDWLDVCVPTGMLHLVYSHVHYPLERALNPWMNQLDHVLLGLAEAVYAVSPFSLALLGEEVSGTHSATEISTRGLPKTGCVIPEALATQLHVDRPSVGLPNGLRWYPPHSRFA